MEVGRSLASQFLLLSVVGADGHEPKATMVGRDECVDRVVGRDDRFGCAVFINDQPGEGLVLKGDYVSDLAVNRLLGELFTLERWH